MSKYGIGQGRVASSWISRIRKDGHADITAAMTARTAVRVAHVSFDFGLRSKNETKTMAAVNTVPSKIRTNNLIKLSRRTDTCDGSCLLHHLSVESPLVAAFFAAQRFLSPHFPPCPLYSASVWALRVPAWQIGRAHV